MRGDAARGNLWTLESQYLKKGFSPLCGVDEAGAGPLAGPVYAAAVILPEGYCPEGLDDSKRVSAKNRLRLYEEICAHARAYSVAAASVPEIEEHNILRARLLAMRRAVEGLRPSAAFALVDGNALPELSIPALAVVRGDGLCASIAAASILAKVTRDRHMEEMAARYPEYGFEQHKGYPTKLHYQRLAQYGPSPIHRRSFLKTR